MDQIICIKSKISQFRLYFEYESELHKIFKHATKLIYLGSSVLNTPSIRNICPKDIPFLPMYCPESLRALAT